MSDEEPKQTKCESEVGLSEETNYVALYPNRKHAEEWMEEAEEQVYGIRWKYLYELIQEARAVHQEGSPRTVITSRESKSFNSKSSSCRATSKTLVTSSPEK